MQVQHRREVCCMHAGAQREHLRHTFLPLIPLQAAHPRVLPLLLLPAAGRQGHAR